MHTPMHTHSLKHKVTEHQSQKIGGKSRKAKACSSEPTTEDLLTVSQVTNTSSDLTNSLKTEMNYFTIEVGANDFKARKDAVLRSNPEHNVSAFWIF